MLSIASRDGPKDAELIHEIEHLCEQIIPEFIRRFSDHAATADQADELDDLRDAVRALEEERDDLRDQVARLESELSLVS